MSRIHETRKVPPDESQQLEEQIQMLQEQLQRLQEELQRHQEERERRQVPVWEFLDPWPLDKQEEAIGWSTHPPSVIASSKPMLTGAGSVFNLAGAYLMDEPIAGLVQPVMTSPDEVSELDPSHMARAEYILSQAEELVNSSEEITRLIDYVPADRPKGRLQRVPPLSNLLRPTTGWAPFVLAVWWVIVGVIVGVIAGVLSFLALLFAIVGILSELSKGPHGSPVLWGILIFLVIFACYHVLVLHKRKATSKRRGGSTNHKPGAP
jgi:hypothetical protein